MYIQKSVGLGGVNNKNDVSFIQEILNEIAETDGRIPGLEVDGKIGKNTNSAIYKFQKFIVKLKSPDSRIDPNGRSEKTLVAKAIEIDLELIPELMAKYKLKKEKLAITGSGPRTIHYREHAKKVVSTYSENVIKLAMGYAGINKADISSTIRTFDDQSRIMYNNCKKYPGATSVETLKAARGWGYGAAGREVEKLYFENKDKKEEEVRKILKDRIEELYKKGKKVSLHCVSEADYKKKNVLDIPYSSVVQAKQKKFEQVLMSMSSDIKNVRYTKLTPGESYVNRLIIEDRCWHVEISQDNKTLPNQKKPFVPKRRLKPGKVTVKVTRNYWYDFLDEWF